MNIVHSWLGDFLAPLPAPDETARLLAGLGIEVAAIRRRRIPSGVVIARVISVSKHPNAEKLSVCSVDAGAFGPATVVCGAPNVAAGMTTAFAPAGTTLASGMIIKKAVIRGISSDGMLCSEQELGISDDHSGIMSLPETFAPGTALSACYPGDAVLELEITPNRGDCLSALGIARELAAKLRMPLHDTVKRPFESNECINDFISVAVGAPHACPRYAARLVRKVSIGPSPLWLKDRLTAAGLRPINNVVDITNYIMLHFGHPMHAFDYERIAGKSIIVKHAVAGQTFTTLDGVQRQLTGEDLLICDAEKAVALAGIMGGENSGINEDTVDVFLECAYFNPAGIRKTSKRLGLSTDSSYRFERGVDSGQGLLDSLDTAAELIRTLAGGVVASGRIDVIPVAFTPRTITLRTDRVKRLLGISVTDDEAAAMLASLGVAALSRSHGRAVFQVPSFRHDLSLEADLIEEIGRLHGYDAIPASERCTVSLHRTPRTREKRTDLLRTLLAGRGLHEICTNSMISPKRTAQLTPVKQPVAIVNPLTPEMSQMRTTLLANMLEIIAFNLNRKNADQGYFEIGFTYEAIADSLLPAEREVIAIALEGNAFAGAWNTLPIGVTFYSLKGVIETLAAAAGIADLRFEAIHGDHPFLDTERARVFGSQGIDGVAGKISARVLQSFDIKSTVFYAELDISAYLGSEQTWPAYRPVPRFPPLHRDFCFVMPERLCSGQVEHEIASVSPHIESVRAFDVYRGENLGPGNKSIAYALTLRSAEKTLTDKEADAISAAIIARMKEKFSIELRK